MEKLPEGSYSINTAINNGKRIEFSVSLPVGDSSKYNYYIINYNISGKLLDGMDTEIVCGAVIQETGKASDYTVDFVGLPDVF